MSKKHSSERRESERSVQCPKCEGDKYVRIAISEEKFGSETCSLCKGKGNLEYQEVFLMYHGVI